MLYMQIENVRRTVFWIAVKQQKEVHYIASGHFLMFLWGENLITAISKFNCQ